MCIRTNVYVLMSRHPLSWLGEAVGKPGRERILAEVFVGDDMAPEFQCVC